MGGLRWTRRTTRSIAKELGKLSIQVSPNTVARLLSKMKFSLRTNRKKIESGVTVKPGHRERRNKQFLNIAKRRQQFEQAGRPIISCDCKKKEIVGLFKNPGRTWRRKPRDVLDHDFRSDAVGMAVPYGIYDLQRNTGMVVVGSSRETPEFAVDSVAQWWRTHGSQCYSRTDRLLILCDSGGGNSARSTVWKRDLQTKLANRYGLTITVCHYPPGASKWNPIEHSLFSAISNNWQGVPLTNYETVLKRIRTTKTDRGLKVTATLNSKEYEKGGTVDADEMQCLSCKPHKLLPQWNYTISPQINA
jgi:Rhodopirellula transposase DDE domain